MRGFVFRAAQWLRMANYWLIAQAAMGAMAVLRLLPMDAALDFADRAARTLGPLFGRHRVALDNLGRPIRKKARTRSAPSRSTCGATWRALPPSTSISTSCSTTIRPARTTAASRAMAIDLYERVASEKKAHIIFTAHLGNFELIPVAGEAYGLHATAMFRPPNNPYIAKYILSTRRAQMSGLMPSRRGASIALARILEAGGNIGALVDQSFQHGVRTTFFGRPCETSPLIPKLARQFDCDVYPARCQRLPGNRFRLGLEEKLTLPRDADGKVDVAATAQLLNDVVERWIREDPGQWMWFHKRWKLDAAARATGREAGRLAAVVVHHGVARLGEEQPALDDDAGEVAERGEDSRSAAGQPGSARSDQQQRDDQRRDNAACGERDPRQLLRMLAGDAKTHLAGQVVLVDMRPLEQADAADEAEAGGALGRRQRRQRARAAATR